MVRPLTVFVVIVGVAFVITSMGCCYIWGFEAGVNSQQVRIWELYRLAYPDLIADWFLSYSHPLRNILLLVIGLGIFWMLTLGIWKTERN